MKTLTSAIILMIIVATISAKQCKDIVKFDGKFYKKEYLADGTVSKPFFMTYLKEKQKIIFSEDTEPFGDTATYLLDIKSKELKEIKTTQKAVANAIDDKGTIYIGQEGGLFVLNLDTEELTPTNLKNVVFYTLLLKGDKIYYTDYPKKDLYVYENGDTKLLVEGLGISDIVFDANDNIYYYNDTGVYFKDSIKNETVEIESLAYTEVPLVALFVIDNNVYAASFYGVFKIDTQQKKLIRISLKSMYDVVVDENKNLIYSDEESIVRLVPTTETC